MSSTCLVVRTPSGLSGDMLLTGLTQLTETSDSELDALVDSIGVPALAGSLHIQPYTLNGISGWRAHVDLPHQHEHRTFRSIVQLIQASGLQPAAKQLAIDAFTILANAEGHVHGHPTDDVHFHEVGALDSILDICLAAALLNKLAVTTVWCSALPMCDGIIKCQHGLLSSPAPAVQEMLRGIPVYGVDAEGETVTPTALAFLKAAKAHFGKWPECTIRRHTRVYGGKIFPNLPNGALFFSVELVATRRLDVHHHSLEHPH